MKWFVEISENIKFVVKKKIQISDSWKIQRNAINDSIDALTNKIITNNIIKLLPIN